MTAKQEFGYIRQTLPDRQTILHCSTWQKSFTPASVGNGAQLVVQQPCAPCKWQRVEQAQRPDGRKWWEDRSEYGPIQEIFTWKERLDVHERRVKEHRHDSHADDDKYDELSVIVAGDAPVQEQAVMVDEMVTVLA